MVHPLKIRHQQLKDQVYLVTGASQGIGALIVRALCEAGAYVVGVARNEQLLNQLAQEMQQQHQVQRFTWLVRDLAQSEHVFEWAQQLWHTHGPFDGVIHNAGVDAFQPFHQSDPQQIHQQLQLNLNTPILMNRAFLPSMQQRNKPAVLVHMSSVAGYIPTPFGAVYSASKAGLWMYNQALIQEYKGGQIRCVSIHPGFIHGVGMHEKHKQVAGQAPFFLGGTQDQTVVQAVVKALSKGEGDYVINRFPVRPLIVLLCMFPRLYRWVAHRLLTPYLSKVAHNIIKKL